MSQYVLVSNGQDTELVKANLANMGYDDVVIITPEQAKKLPLQTYINDATPYIINHYADNHKHKGFICKGKHQYENKDGEWVCQCGRSIND
jgi:hypothetical protein